MLSVMMMLVFTRTIVSINKCNVVEVLLLRNRFACMHYGGIVEAMEPFGGIVETL